MKKKELLPLFLTQSLRSVAVSLLGFFSAIFIYQKAFGLTSQKSKALLAVITFYLLLYIFKMAATCLAENGAQRFGLKKQIFIGHFLTILTLLAFFVSSQNFIFIWLAAVLWGLAIGFFWFGRLGLMLKMGQRDKFGRTLGWSGVVETTLLLGVPLLGGFLIHNFGYSALFLTACVFVGLAFLALWPIKEQKTHQDVRFGEILKLFSTHKRMMLAYFSSGARGALYSVALILYIYLILKKEMAFGIFFSASMVLVALANFATGSWLDKKGKENLVAFGSVISSFVWLGRFMVQAVTGLFILDVIDRVAGGMLGLPFEVLSYEKAIDGQSTGRALLFRETAITAGSIFGCLLLAGLIWLGMNLKFAFLAAMIFNLFPLLALKGIKRMDKLDGHEYH